MLAEFSRDITKTDLIDKVDVVFYDGTDVFAMKSLAAAQVEDENILVVKHPVTNAQIELTIDGNKLITSERYGFFFDIDYNEQHKKYFNLNAGYYKLQLPNLVAKVNDEDRYLILKTNSGRSIAFTENIEMSVLVDRNGDPYVSNADESDVDFGAWFIPGAASATMIEILKQVLWVEYNFPVNNYYPDYGISVDIIAEEYSGEQFNIAGFLNLLDDGATLSPLTISSRFNNGSPLWIKYNEEEEYEPKLICTFNRNTTLEEIVQHNVFALISDQDGNYPNYSRLLDYNGDHTVYAFGQDRSGEVELRNGRELWLTSASRIWDIDIDKQHCRTLQIRDEQETEDWAFRIIENPNFNDDQPYKFVAGFKTDVDGDYIYIPDNQQEELRLWDSANNQYIYRQSELQPQALESLLALFFRMEFKMKFGGVVALVDDLPEDLPDGSFLPLTDSLVVVS